MSLPSAPRQFGRYLLHERIGRGGMAEIFRASLQTGSFKKSLVIKRVLEHLADDEEFIQGFALAVQTILGGGTINYDGASGPVDFDALGNVASKFAEFEVIGGEFVETTKYDCISDPSCPEQL